MKGFYTPRNHPIRWLLIHWFRTDARDLPWRRTRDPYAIWVSETMLQQTRVEQCIPYFERFMAAFPTVHALAEATLDRVLKVWEGLGYYTRARNLHRAAQIIAHDRHGNFPRDVEGWQALPGVGRYTAGAVTSIAFDVCAPVLDGNVKRVLTRVFNIAEPPDDARVEQRLWELAASLASRHPHPGEFNQALMELGAQTCLPAAPRCPTCPAWHYCKARLLGIQDHLPVSKPKKSVPHYDIVVAAIKKRGRYLIGKRPLSGLLGGLWEFPGGKVQPGESHEQALQRELKEELGITIKVGKLLAVVNHAYSHFKVTLHVFQCCHLSGKPRPNIHTELRWAAPREFSELAFPKANLKFLPLL
ncbi:MAG: A/G-specific adenine glycosylase [Candidatus Hydrogenedentes bacterium]|nr:A/G-specific adenine glycosylase [Candidatus Hydrogenedentota bacterium]